MKKKILAYVLTLTMAVTFIPIGFGVSAAEKEGTGGAIDQLAQQLQDPANDPFDYPEDQMRPQAAEEEGHLDLRNYDTDGDGVGDTSYVTPIKCQAPFGTCWGFSAIAAAETSILGNDALNAGLDPETFDLSEKHLAYFVVTPLDDPSSPQNGEGTHLTDGSTVQDGLNTGGMAVLATNTFSSGIGPNLESRTFSGIPNGILEYKGFKVLPDGTTDYENSTVIRERVDGKWTGIEYSEEDDWSLPESLRFKQSYVLKQSYMLPTPAGTVVDENGQEQYEYNPAGTEAIKEQLRNKRAVEIGYNCFQQVFDPEKIITMNEDTWAQYCPGTSGANHAVTIVGYDDRYPKENFAVAPPGNGAWLVKNSWGADTREFPHNSQRQWGLLEGQDDYDSANGETEHYAAVSDKHTGYFWLSYYDQTIATPEALEFDESNVGNQYILDQHDYMPVYRMNGALADSETKMANVFQAEYGQILEQVSCQTSAPGTSVSYAVYLLQKKTDAPENGLLVASSAEPETFAYGGYHKMALSSPVTIPRGQYYSIVITEKVSDGRYAINMPIGESKESAAQFGASTYQEGIINKNESYLFVDGEWKDYSDQALREQLFGKNKKTSYDNFPIKGYSKETGNDFKLNIDNIMDKSSLMLAFPGDPFPKDWNKETFVIQLLGSGTVPDDADITWSISEGSERFFELQGPVDAEKITVVAKEAGTGYLVASVKGIGMTAIQITVMDLNLYGAVLPKDEYVYEGKAIEPKISAEQLMMDVDTIDAPEMAALTEGKDYKVEYKNNIKCGKATVTVTALAEHFTGSVNESFLILPQKAGVKGLTPGKKSLKVTLQDQKASGVSGYQVAYRVKGTSKWKARTTAKNTVTLKKLTPKKKVQVKARAFVKVDGEKQFGAWSKVKTSKKVK